MARIKKRVTRALAQRCSWSEGELCGEAGEADSMWAMDLVASTQYGTASFDGATGPQSALDNLVELCLCAVAERLHGGARDQWCQGADWGRSPDGGRRNRC